MTIVLLPRGAFGPTNNCVASATLLSRRGHRVVFVIEESFGDLEQKGFEERGCAPAPPAQERSRGSSEGLHPRDRAGLPQVHFEQLGEFHRGGADLEALLDGARYVDERLVEIFEELQP